MTLATAADMLFIGTFVGFVVFSILYSAISRWWKNPAGRNVFAFMAVCAVLMGLGVARLIVGEQLFEVHRDLLRVLCYGALFVVVWWRVVILIRVQRSDWIVRDSEQDRREVTQNLREVEQDHRDADQNERDRA